MKKIMGAAVVAAVCAGFVAAPLMAQQKQGQKQPVKQQQTAKKDEGSARTWRISAGFQVGAFWWDPVWKQYLPNDVSNGVDRFTYKMGPNAIFGPLLGFTLNERWSFTWSFMYGRYRADARALIYFPDLFGSTLVPGKIRFTPQKMDSDLLALVSISKYAKLFFGPRYQGYRYNEKFLFIRSSPVAYHSIALGFGAAFNVLMGANFYFLPNVSMVGLVGWEENNPYKISYTLQSAAQIAGAIGVNALLNFGYFIPRAGLTITAGFRVQYLYYLKKTRASYGNKGDLFLGPSFAVVYTY